MTVGISSQDPTNAHRGEVLPPTVRIPSGAFEMGGIDEDRFVSAVELPRRRVMIERGFRLGAGPVSRGEWCGIMGGLPVGNREGLEESCPVVGVSFLEVIEYLEKLGPGWRLPTEAEWEYACRAGGDQVFPTGNHLGITDANFLYDEKGVAFGPGRPVKVGRYPSNGFGLHDMLGNVCEWVMDRWHPGFDGAPSDGSAWMERGKMGTRVIRGGGWDHLPRVLRASWRDWAVEDARWDNLGFRVARDLDE